MAPCAVGRALRATVAIALLVLFGVWSAIYAPLVAQAKSQGDDHDDIILQRGDKVATGDTNEYWIMSDKTTGRILYCINFSIPQPGVSDSLRYEGQLSSVTASNADDIPSIPFSGASKGLALIRNVNEMTRAFDYIAYHGYFGDTSIDIGGITGDANKLYLTTQLALYYVMEGHGGQTSHLEDPAIEGLTDAATELYNKAMEYAEGKSNGVEAHTALWYHDITTPGVQNVLTREAVGTIQITKTSTDPGISADDTGYSLKGAEFAIFSDAACSKRVDTITTDERGVATSSVLPFGTYWVKETKAPRGFSAATRPIDVRISGGPRFISVSEQPVFALVDTIATKIDAETGKARPLGSASLAGAEFLVSYYAGDYNLDELPKEATRAWTLKTDDNGVVRLDQDHKVSGPDFYTTSDGMVGLPLGTVTVQETKAPSGYKKPQDALWTTHVTGDLAEQSVANGKPILLVDDGTIHEEVKRGDISFDKVDDLKQAMGQVLFSVTSEKTGESHVIMTDNKGHFSSASAKHSHKTNGLDQIVGKDGTVSEDKLTYGCGIWFFGYDPTDNALESKADDAKGAFPFDTYLFQEIPSKATLGHELISFEVTVSDDSQTVDLGAKTDASVTLHTTARDATDADKLLVGMGRHTVVDKVDYKGLKADTTYTLTCTLVDGATGSPLKDLSGNEVTGKATWKTQHSQGSQEVSIPLESLPANVKSIVAFERLERDGMLIAVHEDLSDADQTLYLPSISTTLTDGDGDHHVLSDTQCSLTDVVAYSGLAPGETYGLVGTLMDRETNSPILDAAGNQIQVQTKFTAKESSGTTTVAFDVDTKGLSGHHIVAFETLSYKDAEICSHASLDDEDQTVDVVRNFVSLPNTGSRSLSLLMTLGCATVATSGLCQHLLRSRGLR